MPYRLGNLPKKQDDPERDVKCEYENGVYTVLAEEWVVCTIHATTPQAVANQIAAAIRTARDKGFEHGREHVRNALGIEK
jgi:hypothetical protein